MLGQAAAQCALPLYNDELYEKPPEERVPVFSTTFRSRPFGIIIIILINIFTSVILVTTPVNSNLIPPFMREIIIDTFGNYDIVTAVMLVGQVIIIVGLWFLKRWAWAVVMVRLGFSLFFNLREHFAGTTEVDYLLMLLDVAVVFYLNQREVQNAFGYQRSGEAREMLA